MSGYLPYRYFISDFLWNGHLPLWNPFQNLGYPGYSDLQSGCWYPVTWILMLFGKYNITSLNIELSLCFIIAGLGMYSFSNYFFKCQKTALILGLSYGLSGIMTGSTQLMVFLIGQAWLPWVLLSFFKLRHSKTWGAIICSSVCISFNITGASPAFSIALFYILLGLFIYFLFTVKKEQKKLFVLNSFKVSILTSLLLAPYFISLYDFMPYFNRINKLPFEDYLLANPFSIREYLSFLAPFSVISKSSFFDQCDLSLRNAYVGIVILFLFIYSTYKRILKQDFKLIVLLIVSFVLAAGSLTPAYKLFYNFIPGFGLFRHPSFFKSYSVFLILLISAPALKTVLLKDKKMAINKLFGGIGLGGCILVLTGFFLSDGSLKNLFYQIIEALKLPEFSNSTFQTHMIISGLVIMSLTVFYFFLRRIKLSNYLILVSIVFFDLSIQTFLTAPTTIYYPKSYASFSDVNSYFKHLPKKINQTATLSYNEIDSLHMFKKTGGITNNLGTFNKTLSHRGLNPTKFKSFETVRNEKRLNQFTRHPVVYSLKDSLNIDDVSITYNAFTCKVRNMSSTPKHLVLNQNHHHLWSAKLNNQAISIKKENGLVMGVEIPSNTEGILHFSYQSPYLPYAIIIMLLTYCACVFTGIFSAKKRLINWV